MVAIDSQPIAFQPWRNFGTLWRKAKTVLVVFALLGLGALNILTLVSDGIHAAGYGAIEAILASAVSDATMSRMLRSSPTAKRQQYAMASTKALSDEKAMLVASNKAIEKKRAALEKSHIEIEAKNAELTRTSQKRVAAVQKASKRLVARSLVNATRNVSSVGAEAIPLIGTAIIVGVTAWDVYDDCETLKDINEMNSVFGHEQEDQTKVCGIKVPTKEQALAQVKGNWRAAYRSAADSLNTAGAAIVPATPPQFSWPDIRGTVCPVVGTVPGICP